MTSAMNLNTVAQFSAERMLNCMVEGAAIALFAWLLLRIIGLQDSGRQNSGTRFAVWFAALFAIAALPFLGAVMPASAAASSGVSHPAFTVPRSWATYWFGTWALIAFLGVARVGVGLWHLRCVRRSCIEIDPANLHPALRVTWNEFRSARSVKICVSDRVQVPTAIGFLRPVVALPEWTVRELSAGELNTILLHELAHLRRWDDWTNLAQKLLAAVFFFHPAVWWIEGKLSLEREMACDDAVLAETANPRAYAECLVTVAEKSLMRRGLAMAQAAVSRVRQTSQRVAQILDQNRPGATRVWKPALGMVAAFAMVCGGLLSYRPELVSFEDKTPALRAASPSTLASAPGADLKRASAAAHPAKLAVPQPDRRVRPAQRASEIPAKAPAPQAEAEAVISLAATVGSSPADPEAMLVPVGWTETRWTETGAVPAPAKLTNQQQPRLESVVLVYQDLQYDDAGFAHWTIRVWRVNLPVEAPATTANPAKST